MGGNIDLGEYLPKTSFFLFEGAPLNQHVEFASPLTNVNENIGIFCQIAMKLGDSRVQDFEIEI